MSDVPIQTYQVSETERLDTFLARHYPELSRSFVAKLGKKGLVRINGELATKAGQMLRRKDVVTVSFDMSKVGQSDDIELPIIFESDDVIVINKPAGVLTHSKGADSSEGTVASFIHDKLDAELQASNRGGIVHRLDRDTSGIIICAKTTAAQAFLQKQFADRKTKKIYRAIVTGQLKDAAAVLKWPIGRNPKKPQTFRVDPNGKTAETSYEVQQTNESFSLVELKPTTGRTHQLRVHMLQLGHPIIGDRLYGVEDERLFLHAVSLEITLPGGERRVFTSPLPKDFASKMSENAN